MPDLKNSQRVVYKATKVSIAPDIQGKDAQTSQKISRVMQKAGFVRGLMIETSELSTLKSMVIKITGPKKDKDAMRYALLVVEQMLRDTSPMAMLQHAAEFSSVSFPTLINIGKCLASIRTELKEKAFASLACIKADYATTLSEMTSQPEQIKVVEALRWAAGNNHPQFQMLSTLVIAKLLPDSAFPILDRVNQIMSFLTEIDEISLWTTDLLTASMDFFKIEPIGRLHLERLEMTPVGIERGELVYSVPLTPKETVNISHREWSETTEGFENIVQDEFEGFSEKGVAEKNDVSQATESQAKYTNAFNTSHSLSVSTQYATLSDSFGYSSTTDSEQARKDSFIHSSQITSKASARTRKDHKISFKVSSVAGAEDLSVRVIQNQTDSPVRVDYYQMMRKWKVKLIRYGLRMTYDIVIPNPGSELIRKIAQLDALNAQINSQYEFTLPLASVTRDTVNDLAAKYCAEVDTAPLDPQPIYKHKEYTQNKGEANDWTTDSFDFEVDENSEVVSATFSENCPSLWKPAEYHQITLVGVGDIEVWENSKRTIVNNPVDIPEFNGKSGKLAIQYYFIGMEILTTKLLVVLKLKDSAYETWRLKAWNQIRQADYDAYMSNIKFLEAQRDALKAEIEKFDGLTLREMEREAIMKGVLRWLFGPTFELVPSDIQALYPFDPFHPNQPVSIDPNTLSKASWQKVMVYGEFINYLHNAIEWENILYFMYPYFWDSPFNWNLKLFLNHPDPTHRMFLRSGAARVVLTIRPGFEPSFSTLMDTAGFNTNQDHPYVTIAQEIQNYANTNYPGIPPANPDTSARPQLFWEQRIAWQDMQYIIQLLQAYHDDPVNNGMYPSTSQGLEALNQKTYIDAVNLENSKLGLPIYKALPKDDPWKRNYVYKCPGETGDYDLVSYGADGKPDDKPGGTDINSDIWANVDGSVIATWYEYTPTSALDLSWNTNLPATSPTEMA